MEYSALEHPLFNPIVYFSFSLSHKRSESANPLFSWKSDIDDDHNTLQFRGLFLHSMSAHKDKVLIFSIPDEI